MRKLFLLPMLSLLLLCGLISTGFAQEAAETVPLDEFLSFLLVSVGGLKGASALGIAAIIAQILMKLVQTQVGEMLGQWKLLTVSLLTVVAGMLGLMFTSEVTFMAALIHSTTLAAIQVFLHQIYKQFLEKPTDTIPGNPSA